MKIIRSFQLFDLALQFFLLAGVSLPLLLAPADGSLLFWSLLGLLPLGGWQLLSALLLGFGRPDHVRRVYGLTAVAFVGLFVWVNFLWEKLAPDLSLPGDLDLQKLYAVVFLLISFIAGWCYFLYSLRDWRGGKQNEIV